MMGAYITRRNGRIYGHFEPMPDCRAFSAMFSEC